MSDLETPLRAVVGEKAAKALRDHLALTTVGDLLYHFPRRYDQRGEHTNIAALVIGEQVTVQAKVLKAVRRPMRARRGEMLIVTVGDPTAAGLTLTFFGKPGQIAWRERQLRPGRQGLFAGTVTEYRGQRQLTHPEYLLLDATDDDEPAEAEEFAGALIPVYPAASKVPTWTITQCVRVALDTLADPPDPLPSGVRERQRLVGLGAALRQIHRPDSFASLTVARRRLAWDEAFAVQVSLVARKRRAAARPATARPVRPGGLLSAFDASLPYRLTAGQRAVGEQISADLSGTHPMHRLLQGEVGSGKTLCAVRAMLQVVDAGGQAALLAPTEVLAAQHLRSISELLGPLGRAGELDAAETATRIVLITGAQGAAARRRAAEQAATGDAGLVVGTHALLHEGLAFADLGLVVVDEQHRFGVEQRDALRAKAVHPPHTLVMTATPIPRTVAMTVFGDLDVSTLTDLPQGRSPIASHLVPVAEKPAYLDRAWQRLREEVAEGHQAYVVCPRIGDGADAGADASVDADPDAPSGPGNAAADAAAEEGAADEGAADEGAAGAGRGRGPLAVLDVAPLLAEGVLSGLRVGVLHGRLPSDEKDAVMRAFSAGSVDVLVATTVIEVGVNVPNATVMIVLDADRFGVSQLHQLRGRVGRGSAAGLCLLVTEAGPETPARARLTAVTSTVDGFKLAELDLEQRREGDILGAAQSGRRSHLRVLSLLRDAKLIEEARAEATTLLDADPELAAHPMLAEAIAALVDEERAEYLEKG